MAGEQQDKVNLTYLGVPGSAFGFKLAGIEAKTCQDGDELIEIVRQIVARGEKEIILVDESLAESVQRELMVLTGTALVAVVLLPNPAAPKRLAAKQMQRLMIQAVGADIFKHETDRVN